MSAAKSLGLGEILPPAIGAFSLIVLVLMWGGIFVLSSFERDRVIAETQNNNANLARAFQEDTERTLGHVDQIAQLFATQYQRVGAKFDPATYANEMQLNRQLIINILVTDENDNVVVGARMFEHISMRDREHVAVHHIKATGARDI